MSPKKESKPRQPWLKRVLVPFWVVHMLFMLVLIGVNVWATTAWLQVDLTGILVLVFAATVLVLSITEIILFALRRLHPLTCLVFQVLKTSLWTVLFSLNMVGLATRTGYSETMTVYLLIGAIEVSVVLLSFIGTLIYASVIYHRHRHHKPYHRSSCHQKPTTTTTTDIECQDDKDPFPKPKSSQNLTRYRDSTSAPEIDHDHTQRILGEFTPQRIEICEMGIATKDEDDEKMKIGLWDRRPRELEGEMRVHELGATRSQG